MKNYSYLGLVILTVISLKTAVGQTPSAPPASEESLAMMVAQLKSADPWLQMKVVELLEQHLDQLESELLIFDNLPRRLIKNRRVGEKLLEILLTLDNLSFSLASSLSVAVDEPVKSRIDWYLQSH